MNTNGSRSLWRFSLRSCFVAFVALCALLLGWFGSKLVEARRQQKAVAAIQAQGGYVRYDNHDEELHREMQFPRPPPRKASWLRRWLGHDFFHTVEEVGYYNNANANPSLKYLLDLPNVHTVVLPDEPVDDAGLDVLRTLPALVCVTWHAAGPPTASIEAVTRLENVEKTSLCNSKSIGDKHMTMVVRMRKLRELNVWDSAVTDDGVKALATLPQLETLYLDGTDITDEALKHLKSTNSLRTLWVHRTGVTAEAVHE
ncbi:MAG: hypothetical protein ACYTG0_42140, partial [Planctomycetota bacterium]